MNKQRSEINPCSFFPASPINLKKKGSSSLLQPPQDLQHTVYRCCIWSSKSSKTVQSSRKAQHIQEKNLCKHVCVLWVSHLTTVWWKTKSDSVCCCVKDNMTDRSVFFCLHPCSSQHIQVTSEAEQMLGKHCFFHPSPDFSIQTHGESLARLIITKYKE